MYGLDKGPGNDAEGHGEGGNRPADLPQTEGNNGRNMAGERHRGHQDRQGVPGGKAEIEQRHQKVEDCRKGTDLDPQTEAVGNDQKHPDHDCPVQGQDRTDHRQHDQHEKVVQGTQIAQLVVDEQNFRTGRMIRS